MEVMLSFFPFDFSYEVNKLMQKEAHKTNCNTYHPHHYPSIPVQPKMEKINNYFLISKIWK